MKGVYFMQSLIDFDNALKILGARYSYDGAYYPKNKTGGVYVWSSIMGDTHDAYKTSADLNNMRGCLLDRFSDEMEITELEASVNESFYRYFRPVLFVPYSRSFNPIKACLVRKGNNVTLAGYRFKTFIILAVPNLWDCPPITYSKYHADYFTDIKKCLEILDYEDLIANSIIDKITALEKVASKKFIEKVIVREEFDTKGFIENLVSMYKRMIQENTNKLTEVIQKTKDMILNSNSEFAWLLVRKVLSLQGPNCYVRLLNNEGKIEVNYTREIIAKRAVLNNKFYNILIPSYEKLKEYFQESDLVEFIERLPKNFKLSLANIPRYFISSFKLICKYEGEIFKVTEARGRGLHPHLSRDGFLCLGDNVFSLKSYNDVLEIAKMLETVSLDSVYFNIPNSFLIEDKDEKEVIWNTRESTTWRVEEEMEEEPEEEGEEQEEEEENNEELM
jgi:hypothetical protein